MLCLEGANARWFEYGSRGFPGLQRAMSHSYLVSYSTCMWTPLSRREDADRKIDSAADNWIDEPGEPETKLVDNSGSQ